MTFSRLSTRQVSTRKYGSRRGKRVSKLIIHHTAGGTNAGNVALLSTGKRSVSATYCLETSGRLTGIVPEEYRPWTSGSFAADGDAVTVETVNSGGAAKGWPVSAAQLEMLAQLAADLCRRYGWGKLDRTRVKGHREFASTACPGPFLWPRVTNTSLHDAIIRRGNEILGQAPKTPTPAKPSGWDGKSYPGRSAFRLGQRHAAVTLLGKRLVAHGFGKHYSVGPGPTFGPADKANVAAFQRAQGWSGSDADGYPGPESWKRLMAAPKAAGKSISTMASEVIAGKHGNGHANRQKSLGIDSTTYAKVRAEVNRRV